MAPKKKGAPSKKTVDKRRLPKRDAFGRFLPKPPPPKRDKRGRFLPKKRPKPAKRPLPSKPAKRLLPSKPAKRPLPSKPAKRPLPPKPAKRPPPPKPAKRLYTSARERELQRQLDEFTERVRAHQRERERFQRESLERDAREAREKAARIARAKRRHEERMQTGFAWADAGDLTKRQRRARNDAVSEGDRLSRLPLTKLTPRQVVAVEVYRHLEDDEWFEAYAESTGANMQDLWNAFFSPGED